MAEDDNNDPLTLAFVIMAEVMNYLKEEKTKLGESSTVTDSVNPDELFQEAENLLENGQSVQEVTKSLKDKTLEKLGRKISSPAPTKIDLHKQNKANGASSSTKNELNLIDGASCSNANLSGSLIQLNNDDMKKLSKRLVTNTDEEIEHSADKFSSSLLKQDQAQNSIACNTNAAVQSFSSTGTAPLHGRKRSRREVTEVTIVSDDESTGSVECLNTRPSSSASDVFVVEGQDGTLNSPGNFNSKMDDVMIVTGDGNSANDVSKERDSAAINPIAGTSQNDDSKGCPEDEINQKIVCEEALEISHLLPFFELPLIENAIKLHYTLPNRKYTILSSFIASARVEGCKVSDAAYAKLEILRKGKRSREDNISENTPRKKRLTCDLRETSGSSFNINDESWKGSLSIPDSEVTSSHSGSDATSPTNDSSQKGKRAKLSSNAVTLASTSKASTSKTSNAFNEGASTSSHSTSVLVASSPVPLDQLHEDTAPSAGSSSTSGMYVATAPVPLDDVESANEVTGFSITIDSRPVAPPVSRPWEPPHPFQWHSSSPPKKHTWATDTPQSPPANEGNWRRLEPPPTPPTSDEDGDNYPVVRYEGAPQYEFGGLPVTGLSSEARKDWLQDKIALISSIVGNVPLPTITERVKYCTTDEDIERVTDVLLTESLSKEDISNQEPNLILPNEPQPGPSGLQARAAPQPEAQGFASSSSDRRLVDTSPGPSTSTADDVSSSDAGAAQDTAGHGNDEENEREEWIESHSKTLWDMFPDADPEHLSKKCLQLNYDQAAFGELVLELMENKNYPKMEEYITRKKRREMRKKFIDGMSVPEFLELFEEPEKPPTAPTAPPTGHAGMGGSTP